MKKQKILIIGQALPAKQQTVPYDSTMLYDWLQEACNISIEQAQDMFEFDAVYGYEFPGHTKQSGHKPPTQKQMKKYWDEVLQTKMECANKVWILGSVAKNFIDKQPRTWSCNLEVLETIHPSRRNIFAYRNDKENILKSIKLFINE
jgi:hypothetical protein